VSESRALICDLVLASMVDWLSFATQNAVVLASLWTARGAEWCFVQLQLLESDIQLARTSGLESLFTSRGSANVVKLQILVTQRILVEGGKCVQCLTSQ
jgi:hypothetical protein